MDGRTVLAMCAALLASCGGTESPTTVTRYQSPSDRAGGACPLLLQCHSAAVNDRCPEPFFEFQRASAEIAPRTVEMLEALAAEILATPGLELLRLQGFASRSEDESLAGDRAAAIREWLIDEGVKDQLIDISTGVSDRDETSYVAIEAVSCGGTAGDEPSRGTSLGALSNVLF